MATTKTPPRFRKGDRAVLVGWFTRTPGTVTEDSGKTTKACTRFLPDHNPDKPGRAVESAWLVNTDQLAKPDPERRES
jgi:hypothetical protein